jgi:cytochrome c-type biogenesis protein CcmH/NrfG
VIGGQAFADHGQAAEAETCWRRACEIAPSEPQAPAALVEMYLASGEKLPEALELARHVVSLRPSAEDYFQLSTACLANNDPEGGKAALVEAVRRDPDNQRFVQALRLMQGN